MISHGEFRQQIKNLLAHLYDTVYLEAHPLADALVDISGSSQFSKAYQLRSLLKQSIESLRPTEVISPKSSHWRSYQALSYRYISGLAMAEIEHELGISQRQLQRELSRGIDEISSLLLHRIEGDKQEIGAENGAIISGENTIEGVLDQWETNRESVQAEKLIEKTAWTLSPILEQHHQQNFFKPIESPDQFISVDMTLAHLALVKLFRCLFSKVSPSQINLSADDDGRHLCLKINLDATFAELADKEWQEVVLLFSRQNIQLDHINEPGGTKICVQIPRAVEKKILVVDDNPGIQRLISRYLETGNFILHAVTDGSIALQSAAEFQPDAIILDLMIPVIDGWDLLRSFSMDRRTSHIPIVVCSVLDESELAISLGARGFVKKPIDRLQLLHTLNEVLTAADHAREANLKLPSQTATSR